jgi:two-component system response regulator AtoC
MSGAQRADHDTGPEKSATDTILVVDDEARIRRLLEMALADAGYRVLLAGSAEEAEKLLEEEAVELVLTDLALPGRSGLDLLSHLRAQGGEIPVILITAFGTVESAVEAMKLGAFDYVIKPFRTEEIEGLVARALQLRRAERENTYLRELAGASFEGITARSPAMAAVIRTIERVAPTPSTVLISGETGVGKELVARALHARSPRKDQLFVPLNCAAIPAELLEAELFGVTRGAFTGATADRPGKFELAHGGTLFLDEIGDMPHPMQAKLLRVLQEGSVERLGSNKTRRVDVRVVSATHRNLETMVQAGEFRQDLFYRLNVMPLHVPPLRERTEDIRPIATALVEAFSRRLGRRVRLSESLLRQLERYGWPGNVRELNNILERAVLLADSDTLTEVDLPAPEMPPRARDTAPEPLKTAVERAEREAILKALEWTGDNKTRAAELLGVSVRTLWYRIRDLGLSSREEAAPGRESDTA